MNTITLADSNSTNTHDEDTGSDVCPDGADRPSVGLAQRDVANEGHLLERILNTPNLERVVPQLQPDLLHRVIQTCGLEDCSELVALMTPEQLAHIFDLDLWHAPQPSRDEQFDADRFGLWLEVLLQTGAAVAAQKLAGIAVDLVVAGLAQHMRVFDRASVTPYETLDGELMDTSRPLEDGLTADVGGFVLVARREDSWEAITEVLMALNTGHPDYFHRVMEGCRSLSSSGFEMDGLDDLLANSDQAMFDLAADREVRREKQGYVTPAQARAFLQMSRQLRPGSDAMPPANPLAQAYFQTINERRAADVHSEPELLAAGSEESSVSEETVEAVASVFDVLLEAGVVPQAPRALLGGPAEHAPRLGLIQAHLQFVCDHDEAAFSTRSEELAYLANTLMAGCAIQGRPFTAQEASDAAMSVCNLGLENWPMHWLPAQATALHDSFLIDHDLISVCLYAADQLIGVLTDMRCGDDEIQIELDTLRIKLAKSRRAGTPWRARDALDAIMMLDMQAWAVLLALIDEYPTLHGSISTSKDSLTRPVGVSDFEFISENSQIASVREFMQSLPETLHGSPDNTL